MPLKWLSELFSFRKKPLIVGLYHGVVPSEEAKYTKMGGIDPSSHVRELERAKKLLEKFKPGTRIGIELTPSQLERWKRYGSLLRNDDRDVLPQLALHATERGYEVIPINSESRWGRADAAANAIGLQPRDSHSARDRKEFIDHSTSAAMGVKVVKEKLPVAFVGNFHAEDLHFFAGKKFRYSLSRDPMNSWDDTQRRFKHEFIGYRRKSEEYRARHKKSFLRRVRR